MLAFVLAAFPLQAQVISQQKISDTDGGFTAILHNQDRFGVSAATMGDLDGDGLPELAVGAYLYPYEDSEPGPGPGAVFLLSLDGDGTVKSHQLITNGHGGFTGTLDNWDDFGRSVAAIGDLDGDGVTDLAVGADADDDGGTNRGAVWVLFMNANSTVKAHQKISSTTGDFGGVLDDLDYFGVSLGWLGDLDDDGKGELAVGVTGDDDGGPMRGAVWILSLNADGTVHGQSKISSTSGSFAGILADNDRFGMSIGPLGDLDGDTIEDLSVGATDDDTGGSSRGAVWTLFLNADGTVKSYQKFASSLGGFTGTLHDGDAFGIDVSKIDGQGCPDGTMTGVGVLFDDDGGSGRGALWIVSLLNDGTVSSNWKISDTQGGFTGALSNNDNLGVTIAPVGDLDGNGTTDIAVGASLDDDGGYDRGAVWIMFLAPALVQPSVVEFDTVSVGSDIDQQFEIINAGCVTLVGDITDECPDFSVISGTPYEIEPSGAATITVRFSPASSGLHECTMDLGNNLEVTLRGYGATNPFPLINAIADIGNDQGRKVRISFARSALDAAGSPTPIIQYEAYRRIDPLPSSRANNRTEPGTRSPVEAAAAAKALGMQSAPGAILADWDYIGAVPAHGDPHYFMIAPTLADSTVPEGMHWSVFFIRAATEVPLVYFDSPLDSGYSKDNLPPGAPQGFAIAFGGAGGNELTWQPAAEADFRCFNVYRDTHPEFTPSPLNFAHWTIETSWVDPVEEGWGFYYALTAVDSAGNESPPSTPGNVTGTEDWEVPKRFALHPNVPNPFNPSTIIRYDVPAGGANVTLDIFDIRGSHVCRLLYDEQTAGSKSLIWRGTNDSGEDVASGVYLCRMRAEGFEQTQKLVLLR
jgi:hypothetical protein